VLKYNEMDFAHIPSYKLGASYCRTLLKCGGVCIYIHKNIKFSNINLLRHCKEQDLEIAAVKLKLDMKNLIVLSAYTGPTGNLECFLKQLESILNTLHNPKTELTLCGDININYTGTSNKKTQLENLISTYNLTGTVLFPTRITNTSFSTIDNIFVDKRSCFTIQPHINSLSDHDAQLLTLHDLIQPTGIPESITIRNINTQTTLEFHCLLSWELWDNVYGTNNVNFMFNNFLNIYLRCYYTSFQKLNVTKSKQSHNEWITKGLKFHAREKKNSLHYVKSVIIRNSNCTIKNTVLY
jgi:hypothetical protein